jgi:nucleoside-diphosphate-sugar epimerase
MRVLVCGASGCIGSTVVRALRWRGHRVVETSRRADAAARTDDTIALDFLQAIAVETWATRLAALDIDAIVNCAGDPFALRDVRSARLHGEGPIALFRGAAAAGIARIVQVSQLGDGGFSSVDPARHAAEDALLGLHLDAAIVRPSLVHGPGSRTSAHVARRARASLIALPRSDARRVQPIHVFELAEAIAVLVERTGAARGVYELGGASVVGTRALLAAFRHAQGLGDALWLPLPFGGGVGTGVPACNAAHVLLGRPPSSLAEMLAVTPPARVRAHRVAWAASPVLPRGSRGLS